MKLRIRLTSLATLLAVALLVAGCATTNDGAQESAGGNGGADGATGAGNETAGDANATLPDLRAPDDPYAVSPGP